MADSRVWHPGQDPGRLDSAGTLGLLGFPLSPSTLRVSPSPCGVSRFPLHMEFSSRVLDFLHDSTALPKKCKSGSPYTSLKLRTTLMQRHFGRILWLR